MGSIYTGNGLTLELTMIFSSISFFIYHLKLCEIMAFALRTLYATNKSKVLLGLVGPDWEQRIVSDLDSAMNKVVDSIPDHRE